MIPDSFSYEFVEESDCVGGGYFVRVNNETNEKEPVAYSKLTDQDSVYLLQTLNTNGTNKSRKYWEFGGGWDHFDDFLYNAAMKIFKGFDEPKIFKILLNYGRVNKLSWISTEKLERSVSLFVPPNLNEIDLPGISGEESMTGESRPVMFSNIDLLDELYWSMTSFSGQHQAFQKQLDGADDNHSMGSSDSLRAYQSIAISYPYMEGLLTELIDRIDLDDQPYEGEEPLRFKFHESNMAVCPTKTLINNLEDSRGEITKYERDFLIETFYDESGDLGISRNVLAHDIFEATRGFQTINWHETSRRLLVSIAFLDEKIACATHDIFDSSDITVFEQWVDKRERAGFPSIRNSKAHP